MNLIMNSQGGSCAIIAIPEYKLFSDHPTKSSPDCEIIRVNPAEILPAREKISSIDSFISELTADLDLAEEMKSARAWVADNFYDEATTLKSLRLKAGLSQAQLAKALETSQPQVAKLEKGGVDPQLSTLKKLASALGVSIDQVAEALG